MLALRVVLATAALILTGDAMAQAIMPIWDRSHSCRQQIPIPHEALVLGEQGVSLIGVHVGVDGRVTRALVLGPSSSKELDEETRLYMAKCSFRPATIDGQPVEAWVSVMYWWRINGDNEFKGAKRAAALAAKGGDAAAYYQLSLLFGALPIASAEDRRRGLVMLRKAADLGHPHGQFELGRRYEEGKDVEANLEEALAWYRKAAAQGDPLAEQRLAMGVLLKSPSSVGEQADASGK